MIPGGYVFKTGSTIFDFLANKMVSDVDVLEAVVECEVLTDRYSGLVVNQNSHR